MRTRAEHLGAWAEACSWYGAVLWWSVPPRCSPMPTTCAVPHRWPGPEHERAQLTEHQERAWAEIEADLAGVPDLTGAVTALGSPTAGSPGGVAPRHLVVVLGMLVLAAVAVVAAPGHEVGLVVPVGVAVVIGALVWRWGGRGITQGRHR